MSDRDKAAGAIRRPPPLTPDDALFLDFDGTLVGLAPTPDQVHVTPGLPDMLAALSDRLGGAVAVVSGRRIVDLLRLLAPFTAPMAGQHGLEIRHADGRLSRRAAEAAMQPSFDALARFAACHPGAMLEDKGGSVALHYRNAPHLAAACRDATRDAVVASGGGLRAIDGNKVIELVPASVGKGHAIADLAGEAPFRGRVPIFVGDDATDEDGFARVDSMDGVSIKVGPGVSAARYRLPGVAEVIAWLARGSRR